MCTNWVLFSLLMFLPRRVEVRSCANSSFTQLTVAVELQRKSQKNVHGWMGYLLRLKCLITNAFIKIWNTSFPSRWFLLPGDPDPSLLVWRSNSMFGSVEHKEASLASQSWPPRWYWNLRWNLKGNMLYFIVDANWSVNIYLNGICRGR